MLSKVRDQNKIIVIKSTNKKEPTFPTDQSLKVGSTIEAKRFTLFAPLL